MDFIDCSKTFLIVANLNSFSAASEKLGVSASSISKKIRFLESKLNSTLFHRTTRVVTLTESGKIFAQKVRCHVADLEETMLAVQQLSENPKGWLKVEANSMIGSKVIGPAIPSFLEKYPDIKLELDVMPLGGSPSTTSDVVISTDSSIQNTLSFRQSILTKYEVAFYAAPTYLNRVEAINHASSIESHPIIVSQMYFRKGRLKLNDGRQINLSNVSIVSDNTEVLFQSALDGLGIFFAPNIFVSRHIKEGQLVRVLPHLSGPNSKLVALYPNLEFVPKKTKLFISHIQSFIENSSV